MINLLCILYHATSGIQEQIWTEQNMLKREMEVVMCDVEQCTVEMLRMLSICHEQQEGMCTGNRYGTAFCDVMQSTL
jgi:hypothetical protein